MASPLHPRPEDVAVGPREAQQGVSGEKADRPGELNKVRVMRTTMFPGQATPQNDIFCRYRTSQSVLLQEFAGGKGLPGREKGGQYDANPLQMSWLARILGAPGKMFQVGISRAYFQSVLWHYLHSLKEIS